VWGLKNTDVRIRRYRTLANPNSLARIYEFHTADPREHPQNLSRSKVSWSAVS
jgi:hypothetical protein